MLLSTKGNYRPATRQALKEILENSYANAIDEHRGRRCYDRRSENAVKDYRNGTKRRRFLKELGVVELVLNRTRKRFISRAL